jgi:hypothetical protein
MANSNEENEVGDVDTPEDWSGKTCNTQTITVLVKVCPYSPKDYGPKDQEGNIKRLSCSPDGVKQNSILFQI